MNILFLILFAGVAFVGYKVGKHSAYGVVASRQADVIITRAMMQQRRSTVEALLNTPEAIPSWKVEELLQELEEIDRDQKELAKLELNLITHLDNA